MSKKTEENLDNFIKEATTLKSNILDITKFEILHKNGE